MKISAFHLMPHRELPADFEQRYESVWVTPPWWELADARRVGQYYNWTLDELLHAARSGFDGLCTNEHHQNAYGFMPSPNLMGSVLAKLTQGSNVAIVQMGSTLPTSNPPIRVAEEYAMLDCISGGRLIAGLMRGIPHEYIAYHINPDESWSRQREAIELILRCWTEPEPFGWQGEHFSFPQISIWPKPLQKPHPPLVISASSPESARFAGEMKATMGMVLISDLAMAKECIAVYREAARKAGWEPKAENILIGMHTVIADTDEEAVKSLKSAKTYFDQVLMGGPRTAGRLVLQKSRYYQEAGNAERMRDRLAKREAATLEQQIEGGMIFCGSPQSVVKQIRRVHGELGNGVFNFTMKVGNLPDAVVRRGMELFRDRVHPEVRDL
jgi:alkanesulfonate monooxygenase SsuD/methylene tetrahydromethanopterin reductase-like flavin-dependent oxidoreductase (luciferase family)